MHVDRGDRSGSPPVLGVFDGAKWERFELSGELAQPAGVVEPRLVAVALFGAEQVCDGLVADLAGPLDVGAVEDGSVGLAPTPVTEAVSWTPPNERPTSPP